MYFPLIFSNPQKSNTKLKMCNISATFCNFLYQTLSNFSKTVNSMGLKGYYLNPFQLSATFHIEISHLIFNGNFLLN